MSGDRRETGRTARELIDQLVAQGATLREIEEDVIEVSSLGEDARDALWLYAWGSLQRRPQRPAAALA